MQLILRDDVVEAEVADLEGVVSIPTRRELRRVETVFVVPESAAEDLRSYLSARQGGPKTLASGDGGHWVVDTVSSRSNGALCQFVVELTEHEQLFATSVKFGDFDLVPVQYTESVWRDSHHIIVEFEVRDEIEQIRDFIWKHSQRPVVYFPIIRHGVNDAPLEVRLGRCLWQSLDDATERHQIVFVTKASDDNDDDKSSFAHEPVLGNAAAKVLEHASTLEALIEELSSAGILDSDAVSRIHVRTEEAQRRRSYELFETRDLSRYRRT